MLWKTCFYQWKQEKALYFGNKTFNQRFGANLRNPFFAKFCNKFVTFLHFFSFFAQKRWSKYTTHSPKMSGNQSLLAYHLNTIKCHEILFQSANFLTWDVMHLWLLITFLLFDAQRSSIKPNTWWKQFSILEKLYAFKLLAINLFSYKIL